MKKQRRAARWCPPRATAWSYQEQATLASRFHVNNKVGHEDHECASLWPAGTWRRKENDNNPPNCMAQLVLADSSDTRCRRLLGDLAGATNSVRTDPSWLPRHSNAPHSIQVVALV